MILAKMSPLTIEGEEKRDLQTIMAWFEQHKASFYVLGQSYVFSQKQMEELFYRAIKTVHKDLRHFMEETPFGMWVASVFIKTGREFAADEGVADTASTSGQHVIEWFSHLRMREKEVLALRYITGFTHKETAALLKISEQTVKDDIFTAIHSLKAEMGLASSNGCKDFHGYYLDYLERTLERPLAIEFEMHFYQCENCQEELAGFQDVVMKLQDLTEFMHDIQLPQDFIVNLKDRLAEERRAVEVRKKKRNKVLFGFAGVFALLLGIGFFTGTFARAYYGMTEENPELREFLQNGIGERLNLEAESEGVVVRITGVVADDIQTLVFYQIEDTAGENQYMLNYHDGVRVKKEHEIMRSNDYNSYTHPDIQSAINKKEKHIYHGKLSLPPLLEEGATVGLDIFNVQNFIGLSDDNFNGDIEYKKGKWDFEFPVTKHPSAEYALDLEMDIEGIPVRFEKLIMAPTKTLLHMGVHAGQEGRRLESVFFDALEIDEKKLKADYYWDNYREVGEEGWIPYGFYFEPFIKEKPANLNIPLTALHFFTDEPRAIELDMSQEGHDTFEYAGSTISVEVKAGESDRKMVVVSDHEIEGRIYDSLQFEYNFLSDTGEQTDYWFSPIENKSVIMDKEGNKYDTGDASFDYEKIEQPRTLETVQTLELESVNPERMIDETKRVLNILGYYQTKYRENLLNISLE